MQETNASDSRVLLFVRLFLCFLCARALFLLPLFLPLEFLSFWSRVAARLGLCLMAALLICGPERILRASVLSQRAGSGTVPGLTYSGMIRKTAVRLVRAAPFAVLFLIPSVLMVYCVFDKSNDLKAMRILKNIGDFLKGIFFSSSRRPGYDIGSGALLLAAAVFLILAAICWHRDVPMDYGAKPGAFRRKNRAVWKKTSFQNLLLGLPAYALWLVSLVISFRALNPGKGRGLFNSLMTFNKSLEGMAQNRELLVYLLLILVLVYLPCWCLRKWKLTRACAEGFSDAA